MEIAESGDSDPEIERLGYLIAAVRQFENRLLDEASAETAAEQRLRAGLPDSREEEKALRLFPNTVLLNDMDTVAAPLVSYCAKQLSEWVVHATSDELRNLARFLDARPIGPRRDYATGGRILGPAPADPPLFYALAAAFVGMHHPHKSFQGKVGEVIPNLRTWSAKDRNELLSQWAPDLDPEEVQRLINSVFKIRREPGRPSKKSRS